MKELNFPFNVFSVVCSRYTNTSYLSEENQTPFMRATASCIIIMLQRVCFPINKMSQNLGTLQRTWHLWIRKRVTPTILLMGKYIEALRCLPRLFQTLSSTLGKGQCVWQELHLRHFLGREKCYCNTSDAWSIIPVLPRVLIFTRDLCYCWHQWYIKIDTKEEKFSRVG